VRIALIGPAHPDPGAAARHTTELARRLAATGPNVIIESWRAAAGPVPDGDPYPRTYRRLAAYRPDSWIAAGRRLRTADLVVFALVSPAQAASYLAVLTALGARGPRTTLICHPALPRDRPTAEVLTRTLLARAGTVVVHSAAHAAQARDLAPEVPIVIARLPPPASAQDFSAERTVALAWTAYLQALQAG
jgi:hypothetical protein